MNVTEKVEICSGTSFCALVCIELGFDDIVREKLKKQLIKVGCIFCSSLDSVLLFKSSIFLGKTVEFAIFS